MRGFFYCVQQPLWEGYDEWAHFSYLQHLAEFGELPSRNAPVSSQVQRSLELVPLSSSAARVATGGVTHDSFWKLNPEAWRQRGQELRALRFRPGEALDGPAKQYEAQQPPLYYLVLVPVYLVTKSWSLPAQVLVLRIVSVVIASAVIFIAYLMGRRLLDSWQLALLAVVLLASAPGLYINACRVGNESLSIVLVSAVVLSGLKVLQRDSSNRDWLVLGFLLGAALFTKAYALVLIPVIGVAALVRVIRNPHSWSRSGLGALVAFITTLSVGGWWYWGQWQATQTILGEQLHVAASRLTSAQKLSAIARVDWRAVIDTGAFSHIWVGGWSFLVVRSWMYRVCEITAIVAAIGLFLFAIRCMRRPKLPAAAGEAFLLMTAYSSMCLAVAYHSLVIFLTQEVSTGIGWYLYSVIAVEVILLALGLRQVFGKRRAPWSVAVVCVFAIALDLYTVHFLLMPYYSGMIGHRVSGSLESFPVSKLIGELELIFERLSIHEAVLMSPAAVAVLWACYLCSTVVLGMVAVYAAKSPELK